MGWLFDTKQERLNRRLWSACYDGKLDKVEQLLAEGAEINAKNPNGRTPLLLAVANGHLDTVRLLIAKGADLTARDSDGRTLLMIAAYFDSKKTVAMLLEQLQSIDLMITAESKEGVTALHQAAERGWDNAILLLLEKGADLEAKTDTGRTPLHWAASSGHFNTVKLLLEKGADAHATDIHGNKPESLARKYYAGVADYLRDRTAVPAVPPPAPGWTLTAPDEIVHTSEKPGTGYALTEVFNFSARMYVHIARNLKTNAESQAIRFFDEFPDKTILENAHQMLAKHGGKADRGAIYGTVLDKKQTQGGAP